jgi:hypothetical protein
MWAKRETFLTNLNAPLQLQINNIFSAQELGFCEPARIVIAYTYDTCGCPFKDPEHRIHFGTAPVGIPTVYNFSELTRLQINYKFILTAMGLDEEGKGSFRRGFVIGWKVCRAFGS